MRIHHVALRVADPVRAAAFYASVLGLSEERRFEADGRVRAIWLRAGEACLMLERELRGPGSAQGSGHLLAFAVDDLGAWREKLARADVPIEDQTEFTLYVRDPDGHRVGLSRYPPP